MKLGLAHREKLQALGQFLVDEFDSLVTRINAAFSREHTAEGEHGQIHAQTVATGRVVFNDIVEVAINEAQTHNFNPGGLSTAALLRVSSTLSEVTLTGLQVPLDNAGAVLDGRVLAVEVTSPTTIILTHESTQSSARNRFLIPHNPASEANYHLPPGSITLLIYDSKKARWMIVSKSNDNASVVVELSANQDDYAPTNWKATRTLRVSPTTTNLQITGFDSTGIPATERRTITNDGVYKLSIAHGSTSSSEANRVYCPGQVRYMLHPRESVELVRASSGGWRILEKADQWVDVAYSASNFTAQSGTWTVQSGDHLTFAYQLDGNKMTVAFYFAATSVSATPTFLQFPIPAGRTAARTMSIPIIATEGETVISTAVAFIPAGQTVVQLYKSWTSTPWQTTTNTTTVTGQIAFMVRDDANGISEPHTDIAHGDAAHADADHSDVAHQDTAHTDTHGDTPHSDSFHGDVAHQDDHDDTPHEDTAHSDVTHQDAAHSDSPHADSIHVDDHGDGVHNDGGIQHVDEHDDIPHGDTGHGDTSHSDVAHQDVSHDDVAHQDDHDDTPHQDSAHSDTAHSDTHADTAPHADVDHVDGGHSDTPHSDSVHQDVGFHSDTAHADI